VSVGAGLQSFVTSVPEPETHGEITDDRQKQRCGSQYLMGRETEALCPYVDCYRQRTTDGHNPLGYLVLAGFGRLVHAALEYYCCDCPKAKAFSKATKLPIDTLLKKHSPENGADNPRGPRPWLVDIRILAHLKAACGETLNFAKSVLL